MPFDGMLCSNSPIQNSVKGLELDSTDDEGTPGSPSALPDPPQVDVEEEEGSPSVE